MTKTYNKLILALIIFFFILPLGYKFVLQANVASSFRSGNIFEGGNRTDAQVDWQDPIPADPGEVIEFKVLVLNDSSAAVTNTKVTFSVPTTRSNQLVATAYINGTGTSQVSDTLTVNTTGLPQSFAYIPGHAMKYGPGCPSGCALPDNIVSAGVVLGTVQPGSSNSYQIVFKAYVSNYQPTPSPTPTMSPSPSPSPTIKPTATPTKTPMPTKSPTATPTPTKTPVVTQSPTATPSPTQSPTSPPELKSKLIICKFEDKNGNGVKDSEDRKISWKFNYSVNSLNQSDRYESTSHWWNLLKSGCVSDEFEAGKLVTINEESKAGWELTGIYSNNQKISGGNYVFQTKAGETKEIWFLNKVNAAATPVPGEPNSCNGTCGSNINCQSGLFCYQGYCRKPECSSDSTCGCAASPTPTAPAVLGAQTPTDLPKTGFGTAGIAVALLTSAKVGHYLYKRFKLI